MFSILILGDAGVGKSTFIQRHKTGEYERKYLPTTKTTTNHLSFQLSTGPITFNLIDTSGQCKYNQNFDNKIDAAIIMFDLTSKISYKSITEYYQKIKSAYPNIPIVLCGNKCESSERKVHARDINFHRENNLIYYDISSKSNYNFEKPFLYLARTLLQNDKLFFIEIPVGMVMRITGNETLPARELETKNEEKKDTAYYNSMTITQLINDLTKVRDQVGNLPIRFWDNQVVYKMNFEQLTTVTEDALYLGGFVVNSTEENEKDPLISQK